MIQISKKEINEAIRSFKNLYPGFQPLQVETTVKILNALVGEQIEFYGIHLNKNCEIQFGIGNGIDPDEHPKNGLALNVFIGDFTIDIRRYDKKEFLVDIEDFYDDEIEEAVKCIKEQFKK